MAGFIALVMVVAVAVAGLLSKRWVRERHLLLKDSVKKQEEVDAEGVEIVVQSSVHERRLKLSLPILSSVHLPSPVGPMKSSIRSALKELRSRQMVQSLCSRFESRIKVSNESVPAKVSATKSIEALHLTAGRSRRRDARDERPAPVSLACEASKHDATKSRSNNLNKFLRSYASNLDNAITAERRATMTSDVISTKQKAPMVTGTEDKTEQLSLGYTKKTSMQVNETFVIREKPGMNLELDIHALDSESGCSNQCDSPPKRDREEEIVFAEFTNCGPLVDKSFGERDEDNNKTSLKRNISLALRLPTDFTTGDCATDDVSKIFESKEIQNKPEICFADPPAKAALTRFRQQVPSNSRRVRNITTLKM